MKIHRVTPPRALRYLPFGYKLMLTYLVFILIPVLAIGYFSHSLYQESIRNQTRSNIQGTLLQIRDNVEYKLADVERVSSMLYHDYMLITQLRSYEEGWSSYERTTMVLQPKLHIAMNATGLKLAMYVFLENDTLPEIYHGSFVNENPDALEGNYNIYHLSRLQDKAWYIDFPEERYGETLVWRKVEKDREQGRISLLRRLVDSNKPLDLREIGFLRLSVRIGELFGALDYRKIGEGSQLLIQDGTGETLYESGGFAASSGTTEYLTIQEELDGPGWVLTARVPLTIMERDSAKVRWFVILICLLCLIVFTFAGMFISRYFSIRVTKIVSVLNAFREGDLHKRMRYRGKDEFSQIASALNEMGHNIKQLIEQVYLTRLEKKEAELETLQAQINPHFLYNTLSSISRLAKFGETDKLQRMVLDLAKFYRLSLSDGRTIIPIHSELAQAEAYINIQRTKFGEAVSFDFEVDPAILSLATVKLVLQPFIENALEHAWFGDPIHVRIQGYTEGREVCFKIIDDGIGMTQERQRQVFNPAPGADGGFGIRNVHSRIQLHFGSEYGVKLYSRPGIGTTVLIRFPAVPAGGETPGSSRTSAKTSSISPSDKS
ncbi:sensor histidine kinase [Paenibacillus sp. p3-SID1389]|uniref:cache domain-containing sensor histidine kinase n=1 Tax=Paenibacillus sp. p3-SID1389 TaxID=2916364 RepID=UPI0021A4D04D|nr:sensor histidine kinase [Paenibacillus sp. p3-SID1389]MCT2193847.1 sensor histidine kinase [Paenibacillus sp. p3-SID1389]